MAFSLDAHGAARELLRILRLDVQRDAEAVLENCTKHLRLNEQDVVAHARRGLTLLLLGRDREAAPDLAYVQHTVPDMSPHLERVMALVRSGRNRETPRAGAPSHLSATSATDAVFAGYIG